jgi:hypothetical protein
MTSRRDVPASRALTDRRAAGVPFCSRRSHTAFRIAASSTSPPDALALADDKLDYALNVWKRCLAEGRWDGYDRRTFHAEAPAWASAQWFERQDIEEVAA